MDRKENDGQPRDQSESRHVAAEGEAKSNEVEVVGQINTNLDSKVSKNSPECDVLEIGTYSIQSDQKTVQAIANPGKECPVSHSFRNLDIGTDEPEHKDHFSEGITAPDRNENSSSQFAQSKCSINLNVICNSKFTLTEARTIDKHTLTNDQLTSPGQIPKYILRTLMIVDYRAREFKLKLITDRDNNKDKNTYDSDDEDQDNNAKKSQDKEEINPMDGLLWVFHCSDISLRRALAIKLSTCQLSVPFLLPDPTDSSKNVTILLSALESITKCWKSTSNESVQEVFATEHPFPVVSFIRIGEVTMSKSFLINKIMSDGNVYHNFFFHKNMEGGDVERKVVDGLVELCWYLPSGSKEQTLKKEICFANLRGDARRFKKQMDVLSKISSVLCILLNSECPDEEVTTFLKNTTNTKSSVILVFNEKRLEDAKKHFKDFKSERDSGSGKLYSITASTKENEFIFLKYMRRNIQEIICDLKAKPIVELESCLNEFDIQLDDDQSYFKLVKSIGTLLNLRSIEDAKNLLKLQTHVPVLADLEREKYCPKRQRNKSKINRIKRDPDEIYKDIEAEKEAQKKSFAQLDCTILHFLNSIAVMSKTDRNCALTKVKRQLDKMSLQVLTKLHQDYRIALLNVQTKEREACPKKTRPRSSEEEHLKQLEELIIRSSFGLEHIIRELAQLHQLSDIVTNDYAGAAADMLLSGQPLEVLDGDSSYIPVKWFNAVYIALENKTNDAKIFVISVLGIQSSGKSTMLNTMFGLEFPVSAGRCTRGAFASLIPVGNSLNANFNYVLIIDTEGLRGSRDLKLREHDNELATFAIGVANVTIVNVFGENHNEIKEFLEIAVHAFLKMKLVKEKKTCKVVHQNVAAADATQKLLTARGNLKLELDKMTKVAATQENCEDQYEKFEDVISFDENEDVFYIPSLLNGSPPMAPVNPQYGRAIEKVKENLIKLMCSNETFRLPISQFRERVTNLWTAMLKENFIFSFRNSIEVRAYTSLDRKYFEESVNLMVIGMAKLERKIQVALERCTTRDEREKKWDLSKTQIREEAKGLQAKMEKEMNEFFETSEDKATLEQWIANVMITIVQFRENQEIEVNRNCLATFDFLQNQQDVEEKKQDYEKALLQKAREFIFSAHYTDDAEKLKAAFEQEWQHWIKDVPECKEKRIDVNREMIDVLSSTNRVLGAEIEKKLQEQNSDILNFKELTPIIDMNQLKIGIKEKIYQYFVSQQQQTLSLAKSICEDAFQEAINFAKITSKSRVRCTRKDLTQMYHKVITTLNKESEKSSFKFHKSLKCDVLLHSFAHSYKIFDKMEEEYLQERNIRVNLEKNLRPKLESYFQNLCSEMRKEVLAATAIFEVLQSPIESALNRIMGSAVIGEMMTKSMYQSKGQFHASVLIKLAEEGKFSSYIPYFENPLGFLKTKLEESIENYCLQEENASVSSLLENEAKKVINKVLTAITTANEKSKNGSGKLTDWIEHFVENCPTLVIKTEMFAVAAMNKDELKDIDVFDAKLRENVTQLLKFLTEREIDVITFRKWDLSPHDQVVTSMFGCQSCCPFCKVFCDQTVYNHSGSHCSRIHRPNGLVGYRNSSTEVLCNTICTNNVAGDKKFQNADTSGEYHMYKDYQSVNDYYKSWSIPPDSSFEASTYWQWFMATYSKELAQHYKVEQPDIPEQWKKHTIEAVKKQLRNEYNMETCE